VKDFGATADIRGKAMRFGITITTTTTITGSHRLRAGTALR